MQSDFVVLSGTTSCAHISQEKNPYPMASTNKLQSFIRNLTAFTFLLAVFNVALLLPHQAQAKANPRYASIVMDADTGMILSQSRSDKILYPASLAKMMTLVLTFEALASNRLGLRDRVVISRHAANMVPSKLGLKPGKSIRVEDAIYIIVTKSANDVAVGLAEKIGGTESQFAVMMNKKARELGMSRTHFLNASGLHHRNQVSTARDIAKLSRHLIMEYPEYYHYFSTSKFTYRGKTYRNHNRLMASYKGMDGLKTGYVGTSGFNLAASAVRNNERIIGIVFGGRTSRSRNAHMKTLLDRGFAKLNRVLVASLPVPVPQKKPYASTRVAAKMNAIAPAAQDKKITEIHGKKWAVLNPLLQNSAFSKIIGEGDYDPFISSRLETGLIAIGALLNNHDTKKIPESRHQELKQIWSVQVGAFRNRVKTDKVLQSALKGLPRNLSNAAAIIAPLKTKEGWIFRARLSGYSKGEAERVCKYLKNCLLVSPQAY